MQVSSDYATMRIATKAILKAFMPEGTIAEIVVYSASKFMIL